MRDNSVFLGLCTSHVSRPGWIKKTCYSSLVSSNTRKSGRYLIIFQTVFWAQIFPKLMVMGHFAPHGSVCAPSPHAYFSFELESVKNSILGPPNHIFIKFPQKNPFKWTWPRSIRMRL